MGLSDRAAPYLPRYESPPEFGSPSKMFWVWSDPNLALCLILETYFKKGSANLERVPGKEQAGSGVVGEDSEESASPLRVSGGPELSALILECWAQRLLEGASSGKTGTICSSGELWVGELHWIHAE